MTGSEQQLPTEKPVPLDPTLIATVHDAQPDDSSLLNDLSNLDWAAELDSMAAGDAADWRFRAGPFARLTPAAQKLLRQAMQPVSLSAGDVLFQQDDPADSLYVVQTGTVRVSTRRADGSQVELGCSTAGEVLGEMALLSGGRRTAAVQAQTDSTLLALPAERFEELCRAQPTVAQVLTHVMADRLGSHSHDALCAKNVGDYAIEARLGRGGMSVVYAAVHTGSGDRVALKMMSHRLIFDPVCCHQFDHEAELISRLTHPHIPALRDRFHAFRTRFLVMELIEGGTLGDYIPPDGLPERTVLQLLGQVADAVLHAHELGIVHRDLKPSNLMLDRHGCVKLLDFGLAVPPEVSAEESLGAAGTLSYMAPEQFGRSRVGPQADYFALACIAYELRSGQRIFEETHLHAALRRRQDMPNTSFRQLLPTAGDTLADLFQHALRFDPRTGNSTCTVYAPTPWKPR